METICGAIPLALRKATLERILARAAPGIRFNEHLDEEDGPLVYHVQTRTPLEDTRCRISRSWVKVAAGLM
jgi:hypothetical protein